MSADGNDEPRLTRERDEALGKVADAERRANDAEGGWRDQIIAARTARDEVDLKLEVAELQVGELKKALAVFTEGNTGCRPDQAQSCCLEHRLVSVTGLPCPVLTARELVQELNGECICSGFGTGSRGQKCALHGPGTASPIWCGLCQKYGPGKCLSH